MCRFPSESSPIRIIPLLSTPIIFLGARFATTATVFPLICSGVKCSAIPETIVLVSSPRSTALFTSFFDFLIRWDEGRVGQRRRASAVVGGGHATGVQPCALLI